MNLSLFSAKLVSRLVCNALGLELWRERNLYLAEFCDLLQDFWNLRFVMLWFVYNTFPCLGGFIAKRLVWVLTTLQTVSFLKKWWS